MALAVAVPLTLAPGELSAHGGSHAAPTKLSISRDDGQGNVERARLVCDGHDREATGFLSGKSARRLCKRARALKGFLRSERDPAQPCTQVYGGPQTARIRGRVTSDAVDRRFHRRDGCGIEDWRRAKALLGGEPGYDDPADDSGGSGTGPPGHHCRVAWCHPEPASAPAGLP